MHEPHDTIFAIATPPQSARTILRMSGPEAWPCCRSIGPGLPDQKTNGVRQAAIQLDEDLSLDATFYLFFEPTSYTGQTVVEIHMASNNVLNELLSARLVSQGLRHAGPGEFTCRAYLNGKLDLMQAEAVNEIISGTNTYQLAAAQRLLGGALGARNRTLQSNLMDLLSLVEASMDFSEEDIEFISNTDTVVRLEVLTAELDSILERSARTESLLHLPSVGLAGAPNAGKSGLFNALLKSRRSIVSGTEKTTRDVLAQPLSLPHNECILFDCAGLLAEPHEIIDVLAQRAALESLHCCQLVICCVDLSKADRRDDAHVLGLLPQDNLLVVGTKADRVEAPLLTQRRVELNRQLGREALVVSIRDPNSLETLTRTIDGLLGAKIGDASMGLEGRSDATLLTFRHRHRFESLRKSLDQARDAARENQMEIVAMMLRDACLGIAHMEQQFDEQILERIFSRFCIGK